MKIASAAVEISWWQKRETMLYWILPMTLVTILLIVQFPFTLGDPKCIEIKMLPVGVWKAHLLALIMVLRKSAQRVHLMWASCACVKDIDIIIIFVLEMYFSACMHVCSIFILIFLASDDRIFLQHIHILVCSIGSCKMDFILGKSKSKREREKEVSNIATTCRWCNVILRLLNSVSSLWFCWLAGALRVNSGD